MRFALQRYEPDPHQSKEALTKNRTYHKYRWKDIAIIECDLESEAEGAVSDYSKSESFRLEQLPA